MRNADGWGLLREGLANVQSCGPRNFPFAAEGFQCDYNIKFGTSLVNGLDPGAFDVLK
jgi:hypothetical protein